MTRAGRFLKDVVVLTLSALLMRGVSVIFGSWLKNEIGAAGVGLYQLIMSVYIFGVTVASSGIRLAATRMAVEECDSREVMRKCLLYAGFFGFLAGGTLFLSADLLAGSLLGDPRTALSLRVLALGLPFLAAGSAFNGFFSAKRMASFAAAVQICEQLSKILLSFFLVKKFLPMGLKYGCAALVTGSCISEIISAALYAAVYSVKVKGKKRGNAKGLMKKLLSIALPDAVSSYIRSALNTASQLLVPAGLKRAGGSYESALSKYGMIGNMAMSVIFFPSALTDAVSRLIIPEIADDVYNGRKRTADRIMNTIMKYVCAVSLFISASLFSWGEEIGVFIYSSTEVGRYIALLAPLGSICYIDNAVDGMLKGLGQQNASMRINVIDSALTLMLTAVMLPVFGVNGYIFILYFTEGMNLVLSVMRLKKVSGFSGNIPKNLLLPGMFAALAAFVWKRSGIPAVFGILFSGLSYFAVLDIAGVIKKEELGVLRPEPDEKEIIFGKSQPHLCRCKRKRARPFRSFR